MSRPKPNPGLRGRQKLLQAEAHHRAIAFHAPPQLTLSQWADAYRVISQENSPEPGRWRTSRTPYLREIMDACCDPTVERVVFKKSAQVGWTEIVNNVIGFHIHQLPSPILVLQPTVDAAKMWSKERLTPMLRDTPVLRGKVKESGRRDSKNTIQLKVFPGGYLAIVGSNSAVGLRSRPIRLVVGDEVDAYGISAKGAHVEGDPLSLAIKRTQNFWNRKILEGSTPTVRGLSRIDRDYELSDQRLFFVPCPHCGYEQPLRWKNLRWDAGDARSTHYICGDLADTGELTAGCGQAIEERQKGAMVGAGHWVPQRAGRATRGYFIWAAYSLFVAWSQLVQEWLDAQGNPELLRVFVNTVLGETWDDGGERISQDALAARGESMEILPDWVAALTAGVDVQADRLEVSVWAWGPQDESGLVSHEVVWGDPGLREVWDRLEPKLFRTWPHATGAKLLLAATAVDSGYQTDDVYRFCRKHRSRNVFATKGSSEAGRAPVGPPTKLDRGRIPLFPVGTVAIKDSLFARLKVVTRGPGYVHFAQVEDEYFRQLTAETLHTRYVNRRPIRTYVKHYERNEALDCVVEATAALHIVGIRDQLATMLARLSPKPQPPAPPSGIQAPLRRPRKRNWVTDV
jgi:phage terminase large subunit GpA-like protein